MERQIAPRFLDRLKIGDRPFEALPRQSDGSIHMMAKARVAKSAPG
jgi:hypothetical protein